MTKHLDRSRPFGTVHPPDQGAHYEQDGYPFDAQGKIVEALLTEDQKKALEKKPPRPPAAPKAPKEPRPPNPGSASAGGGKDDEGGVNLEQWLRDQDSANFKDVRLAVKERYSVWETSRAEVVIFLVNEQKLLAAEEIDPELRKLLPQKEG